MTRYLLRELPSGFGEQLLVDTSVDRLSGIIYVSVFLSRSSVFLFSKFSKG